MPERSIRLFLLLALVVASANAQPTVATESEAYADAVRLFEHRQFIAAAGAFHRFRDNHPGALTSADALYYEGASLLAVDRTEEAVDILSTFERRFPGHPLAYEARLALGRHFYQEGRAREAISTLAQVLRGDPEAEVAARALYWMGDSAVALGEEDEALGYYARAAEDYLRTETAPLAQYARAFTLVRLERYEEGAQAFELLSARYPSSPLARDVGLALAEVYYELGDYARTVEEIRKRLPRLNDTGSERAFFLLAESYNQLGDGENAIVYYRRFTEENTESPYYRRAIFGLAWNYYREGAFEWAADNFAQVASSGEDELAEQALYYEGISLAQNARPFEAAGRLERFGQLWPDSDLAPHAQFERGVILYQQRQWEDANRVFSDLVRRHPNSDVIGEAYTHLANTFIALADIDRALDAFESAIERNAADAQTREAIIFQKAWLLYREADYPAAAQAFDALYDEAPSGPKAGDALFWAAESYFQQNNYGRAERLFLRYLERFRNGEHTTATYYALGWNYFRQQRYGDAIPAFERFLQLYRDQDEFVPYKADAELRLADSYYALKRYVEAIRVYGRQVADGDDYAMYQIGQAYANAGEVFQAIRTFSQLLEEYPRSEWLEEAWYSLGYLYFLNREYELAIDTFEQLIESRGGHPLAAKAQYGIGDAHFNAGQLDSAIDGYKRVLDRYPNSPFAADAAAGIQFALLASGDEERSAAVIDSLVAANPDSPIADELRFRQAEVHYQSGQTDLALNELLAFVRSAGSDALLPEAYYLLGSIFADRSQTREAQNYLSQLVRNFPDSPRRAPAATRLGNLYLEQSAWQQALGAFDVLAESAQGDTRTAAEAAYGRGMALIGLGRSQEAETELLKVVEDAPNDPNAAPAYLGLGRLNEARGRAAEAEQYYSQAERRSRDEAGAEALYRMGRLKRANGRAADALNDLGRMSALYGGYATWMVRSYLEQARALTDLDRIGDAVQTYDTLLELYPDSPEAQTATRERDALIDS